MDEGESGIVESSLIESSIHFLILISDRGKSSSLQKRALLATANRQQITCLVEVAYNILFGNTELTESDKHRLKRYRGAIRRLVSKSAKHSERRELLSPPLVHALLKPVAEKLIQHFCSNINSTEAQTSGQTPQSPSPSNE